ncbi:MAG: DUF6444 domain-containing protein, partial [Bacteroidota bacterium]
QSENASLQSKLTRDSHNSSKLPTSDGLKKKVVHLRKPSGKKPGGQSDHQGHSLRYEGPLDSIISYSTCYLISMNNTRIFRVNMAE